MKYENDDNSTMHTVTFSEDIVYHPQNGSQHKPHSPGRSKNGDLRNGYLPHHKARETFMRERSLSDPSKQKERSSNTNAHAKGRPQVPGLRHEVHNLWASAQSSVHQRNFHRQLYGIDEDVILEEDFGDERYHPSRGLSASYDTAGMLRGVYPLEEEEEDWSALFVKSARKDDEKTFSVPATLPDGKRVTLTGELGMRIKDLVSAAAMQYKLPECRIKLALTKAHLNEDADAILIEDHEIQFEERLPSFVGGGGDSWNALLSDFLTSEEDYLESLQSYFLTYEEPLSQLPSLSLNDKRLLFAPLKPFLKCSKRIIAQVGTALKLPEVSRIGNIFPPQLWQEYRNYYSTYKSVRELLHNLRQTNDEFTEFCKELRGAARQSLDSLLLLPVQRVGQYDSFLTHIMDHTPTSHPDYRNIVSASRIASAMVKERQEEVSQAENEARLLQVQERFPGDDLFLLAVDCFKAQKFKSLATRRRSAPSSVIKNALTSSKSKPGVEKSVQGQGIPSSLSSYEISSSSIEPPASARGHSSESGTDKSQRLQPPTSLSNTKRLYIMEGPVHITVGLQTQVRYLFLFDDVLIIAKPNKSCTLFRLKHRLRVCELWLATCTQDVSEINNSPESSFVLGWPTTNNVLTFTSKEEKDLWWQSLSKHIEIERERQDCKSVPIIVCNRDEESKTMLSKTFQAEYQHTSKDILLTAMEQFNLPADQHENYQLWVQSGKEEDLYPLIGHEYPHSIKMNHTREAALHREDFYFPGDLDQLSSAENELRGYQCQFILRRKGRSSSGVSSDTSGIQRKLRNKKSHFKLGFRRSLSSKPSSPNSSESQLFGKSLSVLSNEGEPPQPILDILTNIYNNGPFTHGIFRKSANARMVRELKAHLNAGEQCDLAEIQVSTAASLLTDFLRNLPDCLFTGELYSQWLLVNQIKDEPEKIDTVKRILEKLPEANLTLMRYIFCIFYHITLNAEENSMTGTNLAICISPSMIWPPLSAGALAQAQATKESPQLLQFLILHCIEIFGKDLPSLFGPPPARKETVCPVDSGGDSDGAFGKRNASSMDSIEQELSDDIEPNNNAQMKKWGVPPLVSPSSLSRDSGITSSDNQIYPDSDNTDTTDSGVNSQERLNTILNSGASQHKRFNQNEAYFASEDIILAPTRRARTGSDPSVVSPEIRRRLQMFQVQDGGNENISPETLKFIEDVTKESRSTLLLPGNTQRAPKGDPPRMGYHSPGRLLNSAPSSAANSKSSSLEKMPQVSESTATTELSPARMYNRRVSAPSVPISDQSFPNRMAASRQSASSVSSSSSDRLSDGQSSSSTEKLFSGKAHMQRADRANRTSEVTYYLPSNELQAKNLSPRGSKIASRSPSFMKALTPDNRMSSHRPVASRALNRHMSPGNRRQVNTGEVTPPSEYFPKDAMRHSLPIQDNDKEKTMKTIEEKQETQDPQRPTELRVSTQNEGHLKNSLPSYREAVNRRALFQKAASLDSDQLVRENSPSKSQQIESKRPLSLDRPVTVERQRSKGKERRQVVGIFFHDSESSDDEISDLENLRLQRSLSGSVTGPSKARQIRRSSSDSKASSRKPSNSSNSGKSKYYMPTGQLFYGQDSVFVETSPDRDTPTNSTSSSDRTITSSEPSSQRHKGQSSERNGSPVRQSPRRNFPQGSNRPPNIQPKEPARQRDLPSPSSGLRRSRERDVLSELKKKNWQKSRKGDSFDSGMAADEFANMDFDDESYV